MRDDDEPTVLVVEHLPCRKRREGGTEEDFRGPGTRLSRSVPDPLAIWVPGDVGFTSEC